MKSLLSTILVSTALLCSASNARAESLFELEGNDLLSPFTKENRAIFLTGAGLTILLAVFEDQISDPAQSVTIKRKPLGKWSVLGDYSGQLVPNAIYTVGLGAFGLLGKDEEALKNAELMIRATTSAALVSTALKGIVREPRPYDSSIKNSFPSGHSTTAFAFASVVGAEHGAYWGGAAYTLATLVAFSRMNDNRHLLHDVVAGATIGLSYGISVSRRMHASDVAKSQAGLKSSLILLPTEDVRGPAAAYTASF
jgi:PAP2 superfamily